MIARFTLGFVLADGKYVYLMRKDHPDFQAGKLNGVGGKLEPGETFADCMAREAVEESGYSGAWHHLATMTGNTKGWGMYQCEVFYSVMSEGDTEPHTCEREPIEKHPIADLLSLSSQMVPHLPVLIMAALARHNSGPEAGFTLTLPAMNWTEETPTSPGWYWLRTWQGTEVVLIYEDDYGEMCCKYAGAEIPGALDSLISSMNCEWSGPIPEPCDSAVKTILE